jgi:hypothetical protein
MITDGKRGDARADLADDASALVAEDRREFPFSVEARQCVGVGVAHACRLDLDEDFARPRSLDLDRLDGEWGLGLPGNRGT